ncbi:MAG TPA: MFS transporter [Pyrinomonadaceae bacterium]|nr:MFS transporter [Pyrinomonadaceae bacterium]
MDEQTKHATTHLTPDPVEASEAGTRHEEDAPREGARREGEGGLVEDEGGGGLRALAIDLTPLRASREFRLLFAGQAVSFFGSMMTFVALPWQMYRLTGSPLAVGLLGVAEFVPIFLMAFVGGALADAVDRRRMVRLTEAMLAAGTLVLAVNSLLPEPRAWVLYFCAGLFSALNGLQRPSLDALMPRLVGPELVPSAMALRTLGATVGMIGGPAVGGLLVTSVGPAPTYLLDFVSFAASLAALWMMREAPPPPGADRPSLRSIIEGLRYARSRPELLGTYLVDINAMFFGMPMALFPAIAERFGGSSVGLLYAAPAAGAMLMTLTSGWTKRVNRHGLCVALAAAVWGLAIVGFGFAPTLPAALLFLAVAGGADMVSGLFRMTIWNQTIPDHLRGRLAGIEVVSYTTGPLLGNAESGVAARLFGVRASVVSGGLLCVAGTALLSLLLPEFIRYDGRGGLERKRAEEEARLERMSAE